MLQKGISVLVYFTDESQFLFLNHLKTKKIVFFEDNLLIVIIIAIGKWHSSQEYVQFVDVFKCHAPTVEIVRRKTQKTK